MMAGTETHARGERTRLAILEAAERLFLANGYSGTSMRQIAREAGDLAVGGIYNHFQSKEDIFRSLLELRSPYHHIAAVLDTLETQDGVGMLTEAFARLEGVLASHVQFLGLVLIDFQEFEGKTIRHLINTILPKVVTFGQRLQATGDIRDNINPYVLMRTFAMMMIGYVITQFIAFSGDRLQLPAAPQIDQIDWHTALIDVLLHGIADDRSET
jgi:AcrR family transcriptional regulator